MSYLPAIVTSPPPPPRGAKALVLYYWFSFQRNLYENIKKEIAYLQTIKVFDKQVN